MTMIDVRQDERVRSFLRARILFNNHNTTVECIVKNISASGAKIDVNNSISIPSEFDLDIPQKGKIYRAKMMWRDTVSIGVSFVEAVAEPAAEVDPEIKRLKRENQKLKTQLAMLKKRLEDLGQDVTFEP